MRKRGLIAAIFLILTLSVRVFASDIEIFGTLIPLPANAKEVSSPGLNKARMVTYKVKLPVSEVVGFYKSFLKQNGFEVIGGNEEGEFNLSVKKNTCLFTLRVFPEGSNTVIQFIW
ncbi:MAG: hypothetical protein KJ880_04860 [Candidatus Omnitrophica bacterium]|nr:hypothetical protein [Candidatus Omnitrophota bacterium]